MARIDKINITVVAIFRKWFENKPLPTGEEAKCIIKRIKEEYLEFLLIEEEDFTPLYSTPGPIITI